jgi:hypothetical protein
VTATYTVGEIVLVDRQWGPMRYVKSVSRMGCDCFGQSLDELTPTSGVAVSYNRNGKLVTRMVCDHACSR